MSLVLIFQTEGFFKILSFNFSQDDVYHHQNEPRTRKLIHLSTVRFERYMDIKYKTTNSIS